MFFQDLLRLELLSTLRDVERVCSSEALLKELFDPVGRMLFRKLIAAHGSGLIQV